jgi:catechol 2,3-dioxygenase-like lactoylglutathione lyase family enzyme
MATVRYIVNDVDASLDFYRGHLGFREVMHPAPEFAMLVRDDLRLAIVSPVDAGHPGGGSRPMPDGTRQEPGGWNRFALEVDDLEGTVDRLHAAGVPFRSGIISGIGGKQALVQDPSGNLVELFQPTRPEARERTAFEQHQQG